MEAVWIMPEGYWYVGGSEARVQGGNMVGLHTQDQEEILVRSRADTVAQEMRKQKRKIDELQETVD